ncbi:MAG TPA: hypothetical protein VEH84_14925 [Alphaproteobacteria bacterium]|nr:hypothetical protein [Alphaproteobacteria bacterium]
MQAGPGAAAQLVRERLRALCAGAYPDLATLAAAVERVETPCAVFRIVDPDVPVVLALTNPAFRAQFGDRPAPEIVDRRLTVELETQHFRRTLLADGEAAQMMSLLTPRGPLYVNVQAMRVAVADRPDDDLYLSLSGF